MMSRKVICATLLSCSLLVLFITSLTWKNDIGEIVEHPKKETGGYVVEKDSDDQFPSVRENSKKLSANEDSEEKIIRLAENFTHQSYGEILKTFEASGAENFQNFWRLIGQLDLASKQKANLKSYLLGVYSSSGRYFEAWEIALTESNTKYRDNFLVSIAARSNLSLSRMFQLLNSGAQVSPGVRYAALVSATNVTDSLEEVDQVLSLLDPSESSAIFEGLSSNLNFQSGFNFEKYNLIFARLKASREPDELANFVGKCLRFVSGEKEVFGILEEYFGQSDQIKMTNLIINSLLDANPKKGILLLSAADSVSAQEIGKYFSSWNSIDPNSALAWLESDGAQFGSGTLNEVYLELVKSFTKESDFLGAREYLVEIKDEDTRKKAEWILWKHQESKVRQDVKKNSAETVGRFLNQTSEYDLYMLEEAMSQWIMDEPEDAAHWTESNIDNMEPVARQYVAASYATEAAAQRDIKTARQWANLIQDEKTLKRINGVIKKVEQASSN